MLVLSRKKGQSIIIGDNIEITVVEIQGDTVRIGVNAPKEVSVHREEIYQRIQHERAMHEHLQQLDDNFSPNFNDDDYSHFNR